MHRILKDLEPAVEKDILIIIAALVWGVVGILLCNLASGWLKMTSMSKGFWLGISGLILSLFIYHFGFMKLVKKNSKRIMSLTGKSCIFAFQPWKSYITIIIMIMLGFTLRHSPLPKPFLAIIYIGFGLAMILSSLKYIWIYLREMRGIL